MTSEAIDAGWVPSACTLPTPEQPLRLAEFDELFTAVREVHRTAPDRLRLKLADSPGRKEAVQDLVARETLCCSFFTFTVNDQDGLILDVSVPPQQIEVLDAIVQRASLLSGRKR